MVLKYTSIFLLMLGITPCFGQTFANADPANIALFPQQNESRNTLSLSGMWQFKKDTGNVGEQENWQNGLKNSQSIAVPGSWKCGLLKGFYGGYARLGVCRFQNGARRHSFRRHQL
jgi:beta-glucuronidase